MYYVRSSYYVVGRGRPSLSGGEKQISGGKHRLLFFSKKTQPPSASNPRPPHRRSFSMPPNLIQLLE